MCKHDFNGFGKKNAYLINLLFGQRPPGKTLSQQCLIFACKLQTFQNSFFNLYYAKEEWWWKFNLGGLVGILVDSGRLMMKLNFSLVYWSFKTWLCEGFFDKVFWFNLVLNSIDFPFTNSEQNDTSILALKLSKFSTPSSLNSHGFL